MSRAAYALALISLFGCTSSAAGIPNLVQLSPGVWRSGQPATAADWKALQQLGIRTVVKLNFPAEGSSSAKAWCGT